MRRRQALQFQFIEQRRKHVFLAPMNLGGRPGCGSTSQKLRNRFQAGTADVVVIIGGRQLELHFGERPPIRFEMNRHRVDERAVEIERARLIVSDEGQIEIASR